MDMRKYTAATAVLGVAALLAACSPGSSPDPETPGESPDATNGQEQEDVSLVWATWASGDADQQTWQDVADSVTAVHPQIDVSVEGAPWDGYWTSLGTRLTSDSGTCIVSLQSLRVGAFTEALLPLDELVERHGTDLGAFTQSAVDGMRIDNELYALPYDTGPLIAYYNRDAMEAAGVEVRPGWTVEEFLQAGESLADTGVRLIAPTVEDMYLQSMILAYNGGRVIDENGEFDLGNQAFAEGLDWLGSLVASDLAVAASGADYEADDNAFINGQTAMVVQGPWALRSLQSRVDFPLGIVTLPAGGAPVTFSAGSGWGIAAECPHPDEAFLAIDAMTSEPVMTPLAEVGRFLPARIESQPPWYTAADVEGVEAAFQAALESSIPLPGNPSTGELNQLFAQYAVQAINGQSSGADVMAQIAAQLD